jgi:hypothetical protein
VPEARQKIAHGKTVGQPANQHSSPGRGGRKSTGDYFFRPIRGWVGFIALPTAVAVGYFRSLLRSFKTRAPPLHLKLPKVQFLMRLDLSLHLLDRVNDNFYAAASQKANQKPSSRSKNGNASHGFHGLTRIPVWLSRSVKIRVIRVKCLFLIWILIRCCVPDSRAPPA